MIMENRDREHFLALKVMRLTKPSVYSNIQVSSESYDLAGTIWNDELEKDIGCPDGIKQFSVGNLLLLPQSFGNIYLGETFSSYISVHNDSNQIVNDITVKADLQTGTQRICLSSQNAEEPCQLSPGQSVDEVIHHEVKEIGTHILVCSVNYLSDNREKMHFRKFYKFQVMKPLDVKTKFYNAEDYTSDEVYLEAQIQNITVSPISLEKVTLDPSALFNVNQLNNFSTETGDKSIYGTVNCLSPDDSRQYLYCLTPKNDTGSSLKQLRGALNIGKLDIVWRSNMGERGRLQTSQLQRMAPGYGDFKFMVEEIPEVAEIEKPFTLKCRISNLCERTMDLVLMLDNSQSPHMSWVGISGRLLGKLEPNGSCIIKLEIIPIELGLQTISGIKLKDLFLRRTYDYDGIAQVFITDSINHSR